MIYILTAPAAAHTGIWLCGHGPGTCWAAGSSSNLLSWDFFLACHHLFSMIYLRLKSFIDPIETENKLQECNIWFLRPGTGREVFLRSFSQPPEPFIFKCFAVGPHDSGNKLFVASFDMDLFQPFCLQTSTSDPRHEDKTMGKLLEILSLLKPSNRSPLAAEEPGRLMQTSPSRWHQALLSRFAKIIWAETSGPSGAGRAHQWAGAMCGSRAAPKPQLHHMTESRRAPE